MSRNVSILVVLATAACCLAAAPRVEVEQGETSIVVRQSNRLAFEYRFGDVAFKPYLRQLCSPGQVNVLRDEVADHPHHHGLMFAVAADGVNYWEETATAGKQSQKSLKSTPNGLIQKLSWQPPGNAKATLLETRCVELADVPIEGATVLTWSSELTPANENADVELTGSHYFGLGMRFPQTMDNAATFLTPAGATSEIVRGDERLTTGRWCACFSDNAGRPVTVVIFDHPKNPRPATWFTMAKPFAYLSATLNLHREKLLIKRGKALPLRYGVAVWDGQQQPKTIDEACQRWLESIKE